MTEIPIEVKRAAQNLREDIDEDIFSTVLFFKESRRPMVSDIETVIDWIIKND